MMRSTGRRLELQDDTAASAGPSRATKRTCQRRNLQNLSAESLDGVQKSQQSPAGWTKELDARLEQIALTKHQSKTWKMISEEFNTATGKSYSDSQCRERYCKTIMAKANLEKPWDEERNRKAIELITNGEEYKRGGIPLWKDISDELGDCIGKQIRERFLNQLDPKIYRGIWTSEEESSLVHVLATEGLLNNWVDASNRLFILTNKYRAPNTIKNRANSKKLQKLIKTTEQNIAKNDTKATGSSSSSGPLSMPSSPSPLDLRSMTSLSDDSASYIGMRTSFATDGASGSDSGSDIDDEDRFTTEYAGQFAITPPPFPDFQFDL